MSLNFNVQVQSFKQVGSSVELMLRQHKFSVDGSSMDTTQWLVPLTIHSAGHSEPFIAIMNATIFRVVVPNATLSDWISV